MPAACCLLLAVGALNLAFLKKNSSCAAPLAFCCYKRDNTNTAYLTYVRIHIQLHIPYICMCVRCHPPLTCISFSFLFLVYFVIIATSAGSGLATWVGSSSSSSSCSSLSLWVLPLLAERSQRPLLSSLSDVLLVSSSPVFSVLVCVCVCLFLSLLHYIIVIYADSFI